MNTDDEGWEARMAQRARERAQKREAEAAEQQQASLESLPKWLNGNRGVSEDGTTVWIYPAEYCICCGAGKGLVCSVFPDDYVAPKMPDWPFTYEHCPLCRKDQGVSGMTFSDTFDRTSTGSLGGDYSQVDRTRSVRWHSGGKS